MATGDLVLVVVVVLGMLYGQHPSILRCGVAAAVTC